MITLERGSYVAKCDGCSAEIDTGQRSFQQAVNYISRAEGWENRKTRQQWWNFWSRCSEVANPDLDRVGVGFIAKSIDED